MPNYLQRIVASGSRTTSGVKLSASSRAVIPPIHSSIQTAMSESGQQIGGEVSGPVMSGNDELFRMAGHESEAREQDIVSPAVVLGTEQTRSLQAMDGSSNARSSGGEALAIAPDSSASTVRVQAPKGLRPTRSGHDRQNEASQVIRQTLDNVFQQIRVAHESLPPTDVEVPQVSGKTSDQVLSISATSQPRPTITKEATPSAQNDAAHGGTRDQVLPAVETKSRVMKVDTQIEATRPLEVRAIAPRQAAQLVISSATDKPRRNQISIGRIDVQVNNQTTPQPVATQPTKQTTHSNFLDARYLSRFFLRQ